MKNLIWMIPVALLLTSCGLLAGGGLEEAVEAIEKSDLAPDVKRVLIDALREAWAGNGLLGTFRSVADAAVLAILGKFGLDKSGLTEKLFGKKKATSAPPTA